MQGYKKLSIFLILLSIVRIFMMWDMDPWLDEITTEILCTSANWDVWLTPNMNLYPMLVKILSFNDPENVLMVTRALSFICWLATILLIFATARGLDFSQRDTASITALFPVFFSFAVVGRSYMMATFFMALALWAIWGRKEIRWQCVAIGLGGAFMTHVAAAPCILVIFFYACWAKKIPLRLSLKIILTALVIYLPGFILLPYQFSPANDFMHTHLGHTPVFTYFTYALCPLKASMVAAGFQALIYAVILFLGMRKGPWFLLWLICIFSYIGLDAIKPGFVTSRHSFFASLFFILALAQGLKQAPKMIWPLLLALAASCWQADQQAPYRTGTEEILKTIEQEYQAGDLILLIDSFDAAVMSRDLRQKLWFTDRAIIFDVGLSYFDEKHLLPDLKSLLDSAKNYPRVWLLYPHEKLKNKSKYALEGKSPVKSIEIKGGWKETRLLELWTPKG
jgi:hypothetical protein